MSSKESLSFYETTKDSCVFSTLPIGKLKETGFSLFPQFGFLETSLTIKLKAVQNKLSVSYDLASYSFCKVGKTNNYQVKNRREYTSA